MKYYKIIIIFQSGDKVHARIEARNQSDALDKLMKQETFIKFTYDNDVGGVDKVEIIPEEKKSIDNKRFAVTNIKNKKGWYVVADLDNRIKIEFKKGHYNDMQKVSYFGKGEIDALQSATALREIGEYMYEFFKELI